MVLNPVSHEDAHAMAQKVSQFVDSTAFEAIERQISLLVMTDDLDDEANQGASENHREALWFKLATG